MATFMSLEQMIDQACDEINHQPNLSLNLEIVDVINRKKSASREAASAIVRNVNGRSSHTALLALTLLDNCVKNCGYPFHLIISTKEFLNELVRRFPERPVNVTQVQYRILELIQQWNATLCVTSRYKDDFVHINDMYRLLSFKGYRFPAVAPDAAVLNPPEVFKTERELEEEDRIAQGAKLEELLRVGTPAALEQANDLMKVMAGYDLEKRPDYKKEVNEELDRIEQRVHLLNDMLNGKTSEERFKHDSTIEELFGSSKSAQTRIQSLVSSGEEEDRMERLLELNDLINTVIAKYEDFKSGKSVAKTNPASPTPSTGAASAKRPVVSPQTGPINLIDLDASELPAVVNFGLSTGTAAASKPPGNNLLDDLSNLNFAAPSAHSSAAVNPFASSTGASFIGLAPLAQPSTLPALSQPSVHGFGQGATLAGNTLGAAAGFPGTAGLSSSGSGTFQPAQAIPGFAQFGVPGTPGKTSPVQNAVSPVSPTQAQKREVVIFNKNGIQVHMKLLWKDNGWLSQLVFINTTPVPMADLNFQLALPKAMVLQMDPLSGQVIAPLNMAQVTQNLKISNPTKEPLRVRFKLSYSLNGAVVSEQGEYGDAAFTM
ncbi:VHS domain-containing protein [Polychytrium aggregatum]|uniref:VHS domain-containing protein n=1 Tax=Polychytrium aggregatum TaxID=110093 RepID=UPI0022FEC52D|nr:VHS domain-containing protein [Polychytrium aggregatum]KAI9209029.1 VHS domain-containing protein [Polychytrium aggregatum]